MNIEEKKYVELNLLETVMGSMGGNLDSYEEKAEDVVGHASITAEECEVLSVTADADVVFDAVKVCVLPGRLQVDAEHAKECEGAHGAQCVFKAESHRARLPGQAGPHSCVRQENKAMLAGQVGPKCFAREQNIAKGVCGRERAYRPHKGLGAGALGEGAEEPMAEREVVEKEKYVFDNHDAACQLQ